MKKRTAPQPQPGTIFWAQLETRNFTFDAFGLTEDAAIEMLLLAVHAHAYEYGVDAQYFIDLISDWRESGNVRMIPVAPGRAYRDSEEIVR